jgi:hypothetical protein
MVRLYGIVRYFHSVLNFHLDSTIVPGAGRLLHISHAIDLHYLALTIGTICHIPAVPHFEHEILYIKSAQDYIIASSESVLFLALDHFGHRHKWRSFNFGSFTKTCISLKPLVTL